MQPPTQDDPDKLARDRRGDVRMLSTDAFRSLVLEGQGPIAVEFMSYGCAHCREIEPIVQEVAGLVKRTETIFQVNVALQEELVAALAIEGTPTFVMFLNGEEVGRASGPQPNVESVLAAVTAPFA
jgi:thioredoxin 1